MDDDLLWLDATAQADLVRRREVTPRELVEAAIARIEAVDPQLNAVIHRRFERALDEAGSAGDGGDAGEGQAPGGSGAAGTAGSGGAPFRGVPFLVKDLYADSAGDPAHHGSKALRDAGHVAQSDCWLVARYKRAGFVVLGRTNTPELGLVPVTEPQSHGPTRNPWNTAHSPGGSSGGSAAAVAAGMVPIAHGSDGGGSIRIPASMCGLVGLKPSRGRITMGPDRDESGLSVQNVLGRSVRDVAAVLDATAGPGPGDMAIAPPPLRPYVAELSDRSKSLRVGLLAHNPSGTALHPDCEAAVLHTGSLLESLGHHVEHSYPEIDPGAGARFAARWSVNTLLGVLSIGQSVGRELTADDVEPLTWAFAEAGRRAAAVDYALAVAASARFTRDMARWWASGMDLLVTPTLGEPPPLVGEIMPEPENPFGTQARIASLVPFTPHFNVTGQPAISLPLWWNEDGLPIGTQVVAAYGGEDILIRIAAQLEEAQPWAQRRPVIA